VSPSPLSISALSTQLIQVVVTNLVSGLPVDPTANPVALAFVLGRQNPGSGDWHTGSWQPDTVNGQYWAQVLIGPDGGSATLTQGNWTVWLRVSASPETLITQSGSLTVY
jgi:hypothetical protein